MRLGEWLAGTIVLKPETQTCEAEVLDYAKSRLALYKAPRKIAFTDDRLPRTATGKVAREVFMEALEPDS